MINYTAARKYVTPQNAPLILKEAKKMRKTLQKYPDYLCVIAYYCKLDSIYGLLQCMFNDYPFISERLKVWFHEIELFHGSRHNLLEAIITELELYIKNNKA